jgi:hypothetical protein
MPFPGDKFKPSASREREVTKLLEAARGERVSFGVPSLDGLGPGHVIAKNTTGADLAIGKAALIPAGNTLGVSSQEVSPRKDMEYRKGYYTLKALTPLVTPADPFFESFALTLEPIPNRKFGRVAIAGLAVANYTNSHGFVFPISGGIGSGIFGLAKVVANTSGTEGSSAFAVWDLSCRAMQANYSLTSNWSGGAASATIGGYSTQIGDVHNIAQWQVNGDKGMAVYLGGVWQVITPWCVGS